MAFSRLPESEALAAANKRVKNILDKSGRSDRVDASLFSQDEERRLHAAIAAMTPVVDAHVAGARFEPALVALAGVRGDGRCLLRQGAGERGGPRGARPTGWHSSRALERLLNRVADISRLAA